MREREKQSNGVRRDAKRERERREEEGRRERLTRRERAASDRTADRSSRDRLDSSLPSAHSVHVERERETDNQS